MKMNHDDVLSVVGLAYRAKKVTIGFDPISQQARMGTVSLIVLAADCSEGTAKSYKNKCQYYQIPCIRYGTRETIGKSVGKQNISAVAICDDGFATLVLKKIGGEILWQ